MTTNWTKITVGSTSWTKTPKPVASGGGTPIGLLLSLTYSQNIGALNWNKVVKPSGTTWTKVIKAT